MLPNGRRLGAHLPLGHGMVRAADRAARIGASALQVFSDNPASWHRRPTLPRELPAFRDRLAEHDIAPLSIHAPYLVNLAGPEPDLHERSVTVLANELRVAAAYGARYVNVHVGSHRGAGPDAGLERLAEGIRKVVELAAADDGPGPSRDPGRDPGRSLGRSLGRDPGRDPGQDLGRDPGQADVILVLENGAGGGFGMGATFDELQRIDEAVVGAGVDRRRFGYCLDTAHAWGAGYPIDTPQGVDVMLAEFEDRLGLDRLHLVHLNDSRAERGSLSDRHEHLGGGLIGALGLGRMVTHPALDHVTYILETPGMEAGYDEVNILRVLEMAAGRPLADLPPEAYAARASRGRSAPAEDPHGPPVPAPTNPRRAP